LGSYDLPLAVALHDDIRVGIVDGKALACLFDLVFFGAVDYGYVIPEKADAAAGGGH